MRSLCLEVENEFSRDEIHIVYQNQEFVIYGASPANRGHIQAVLISKIPYNLPCRANFQPQREWEDTHDVAHTIRVSNAAFADVGVPT